MTPTVTVWPRPNGLPIAMTQSPCCICDESPNFASWSGCDGISVSWRSALSVSGSWPTTLAAILLVARRADEGDGDLVGPFDDVVVGQDEAGLVDDEAGAGALRSAVLRRSGGRAGCAAVLRRDSAAPAAAEEPAQQSSPPPPPPPKNSVRSCVRCRDSVRMLTTVGICVLAMFRNVVASIGPPSGALFIARHRHRLRRRRGRQIEARGDHHADGDGRDRDEDGVKKRGLASGH